MSLELFGKFLATMGQFASSGISRTAMANMSDFAIVAVAVKM
jgi:hypothetical protein